MNLFVNPKNRGVQLPKGCKDLADVLLKSQHRITGLGRSTPTPKCDYCGGGPVGGLRMLGDEPHFWCEQCRQDLTEFYAQSEIELPEAIDSEDPEFVRELTLQIEKVERRKKKFIRRKVTERKKAM